MSSPFTRPRQVSLLGLTAAIAVGGMTAPVAHATTAPSPAASGTVPGATNGVIAFTEMDNSSEPAPPPVIKTVNPDGTGYATLPLAGSTLKAGHGFAAPAYSPDGTKIVFDATAVTGPGAGMDQVLWIAHADGSGAVQLTANNSVVGIEDSVPRWSGDGQHILFDKYDTTNVNVSAYQIWEVNADGTGEHAALTYPSGTGGRDYDASQAPNGDIAFTRSTVPATGPTTIGVWVRDHATGTETLIAPGGQMPMYSPDGSQIVYASDSGIMVMPATGGSPRNLTPTAAKSACGYPSWSPDGTEVVYAIQTPTGQRIQTVGLASGSKPVTVDTATPANIDDAYPSWRAMTPTQPGVPRPTMVRLGGVDRIATAVAIAEQEFLAPLPPGSATRTAPPAYAVLSRSDSFADALAGDALAAQRHAPLLLTDPAGLDSRVAAELTRVLAPHATVYVLGGTGALSKQVETDVTRLGFNVKRLAGTDRFDTATKIAAEISPHPHTVLVATGVNFPDPLAAGAAAATDPAGGIVLLSDDKVLPNSTRAYLAGIDPAETAVYGVGGQGVAALNTLPSFAGRFTPLSGGDRYATTLAVASNTTLFPQPTTAGIATGHNWADALAGGAMVGSYHAPLLLADGPTMPTPELAWLHLHGAQLTSLDVFGGIGAVPQSAENQAGDSAWGTGAWDGK